MAKAELLKPFIEKWEGGYSNHPNDAGGCTMKGITLRTYKYYFGMAKDCEDLKNITDEEWLYIFKKGFWNKVKADQIVNQNVANIIVDWVWMSGTSIISRIQRIVGTTADGIVGNKTLQAINNFNPRDLFILIKEDRMKFYDNICNKRPKNKVFLKGWLNRLHDLKYIEN